MDDEELSYTQQSLVGRTIDRCTFDRLLYRGFPVDLLIALTSHRHIIAVYVLSRILRKRQYDDFRKLNAVGFIDESSCEMWLCKHIVDAPDDIIDSMISYIELSINFRHNDARLSKMGSDMRAMLYFRCFLESLNNKSLYLLNKIKPLFVGIDISYENMNMIELNNVNQMIMLMNAVDIDKNSSDIFITIFTPLCNQNTQYMTDAHYAMAKRIVFSYREWIPDILKHMIDQIHGGTIPALFVDTVIVDIIIMFIEFDTSLIERTMYILPIVINTHWCTWLCTNYKDVALEHRKHINARIEEYDHVGGAYLQLNMHKENILLIKCLYDSLLQN